MYALIDCNNFFVSCERAFQPHLKKRAIGVLSSNDGCFIARSEEVKALGIPMGAPAFKYKQEIIRNDIVLFSSNFALYGDMSERVTKTLRTFGYPIEVYSIDESFLLVDQAFDPEGLQKRVVQWTGIPVTCGVGPTKTLAKVATQIGKKEKKAVTLKTHTDADSYLKKLKPHEIWGIGKRISVRLQSFGIDTAYALKYADKTFIKKEFSVTTLKTILELRGNPCLELEELTPPKQSVTCSRSFGKPVTEKKELSQAIATFAARVAKKLRDESSEARLLFVYTNGGSAQALLPIHTNDSRVIIEEAKKLLLHFYTPNEVYTKGGVIVSDITSTRAQQGDLFTLKRSLAPVEIMDRINAKFGSKKMYYAAEGVTTTWGARKNYISKSFTTSWEDIPKVK